MNAELGRLVRNEGLSDVDCAPLTSATSDVAGRFSINGADIGFMGCYIDAGGNPSVVWTNDALRILSVAVAIGPSDDPRTTTELYDFWQNRAGPR